MNEFLLDLKNKPGNVLLIFIVVIIILLGIQKIADLHSDMKKNKQRYEDEKLRTFENFWIKVKSQLKMDGDTVYKLYFSYKDEDYVRLRDDISYNSVTVPMKGYRTKEEAIEKAREIYRRMGKKHNGDYDPKEVWAIMHNNKIVE